MAQIRKAIWLQEDPRRLAILYFANWQVILNHELLFASTSHHQVDGFFAPWGKNITFFHFIPEWVVWNAPKKKSRLGCESVPLCPFTGPPLLELDNLQANQI